MRGASRYEFQLSTSRTFADNAIVWQSNKLKAPLTTVPVTLPWMTGYNGYAWFARVRGFVGGQPTGWSDKYGFDLRSPSAPTSLSDGLNTRPGMVRWTPVDGATAYEVTFTFNHVEGEAKKIKTATTAADLREYYTFHNDPAVFDNDQGAVGGVYWRVRAVREVTGKPQESHPRRLVRSVELRDRDDRARHHDRPHRPPGRDLAEPRNGDRERRRRRPGAA